jgi:hypothetical protein
VERPGVLVALESSQWIGFEGDHTAVVSLGVGIEAVLELVAGDAFEPGDGRGQELHTKTRRPDGLAVAGSIVRRRADPPVNVISDNH